MTAALKVLNPGTCSTIQDLGRFGQNHLGLTTGGSHDPYAFKLANALVGNPLGSPALEITLGQFQAQALIPFTFAVTGPEVRLTVNNKIKSLWHSHYVKRGDIIHIAEPKHGLRHTLAISGAVKGKKCFGSVSTVLREGLGEKLSAEDIIKITKPLFATEKQLATKYISTYERTELNVVLGLQQSEFQPIDINRFFASNFTVSNHCDRMGYRLTGNTIKAPAGARYSEGINLGAIQVPADGQPIVLLNDRQTIGGYAKLGSVTALDCAQLLQMRPGQPLTFTPISIESARSIALLEQVKLESALTSLN